MNVKGMRWKIAFLMFIGVAINYLDRVNISHSIIVTSKDFNLNSLQKGLILSSFSFGYVLLMIPGGLLIYKFGPRYIGFVSMLLLCVATIACGLATGFYTLLLARFLIGAFESPVFPANAYTTSVWFPKKERAKVTALFDSGSYVGAAAAAPIIIYLINRFNWRISYIFSGLLGLLWCVAWWRYFRDRPNDHPDITSEELNIMQNSVDDDKHRRINWIQYLKSRKIIGCSIGFFCYNYLKSFYLTWLPTYLVEDRKMGFIKLGVAGSIPPLCAIAGELFTGFIVDKWIARGIRPTLAKKIPICLGLFFSSVVIFSLATTNIVLVIGLITISYVFLISASVGIWSIPSELAGTVRATSVIGSIQNSFANIAGIIAPIITGYLYFETKSFFFPFMISCGVAFLGAYSYWFVVGDLNKIEIN